ncbi:serine/threonine-protein kinase [Priestia taiwanensis]|uniref:Serine/threonine-protein kinase PrkC n=1 Tax=Priestia taiwanensis TaxID=1347902 RepID=A0A917EP87_9BACI|nr:Stk1 family PASTA domain-containing Ser/Thr kinase [Priestia taiwanensis]MBM7362885.1 serine/threonine-protein kinase [Priestia taiwanensis]GGE65898.1 serine/threonine protein kinase [Priestia taiwanensis]
MDVMIGKRLNDRYKIVKMIGGGGMANVYLARDIILERDVAVKVLRLDFAHNEEFIKRFRREAHSVTSLSHSNIVNIYDIGEEEGIYYIVMEYVAGLTLKQYIQQKGHLSVQESVDIMEQLTSAMAHAHHCEIVHRDIKPQNILIAPDGTVKVTDFGIAIVTSATTITHTNSVLGSVHYLSPEQARGGLANKKSDIYSLGIVFFELLTGRPPFSGESAVAIALKHLQNETPSLKRWNDSVPQSIENIVLKATAKDPFYRYNSIDNMKEDIMTALQPERMNEPKFFVPEDVDATKVMPVIKDDMFDTHVDETIVHHTGEKPVVSEKAPVTDKKEGKKGKFKLPAGWKKKYSKIIISLTAFIIISAILMFTIFPKFMFPGEIKVPDVTGMDYDKAVAELSSKGFVLNEPKQIHDEEVEEGKAIKTDPIAGANVKEKSSITIYKSLGKKKGEMNNYVGQQYTDIKDTLESKYKSVDVTEKESDKPAGEILSQSPTSGKEIVDTDTELKLVISKGPPKVKMPNVSGWTLSNLNGYAKDNKLKVEAKEEYSETVEKGVIISQSPAPNAQLGPGETIKVVVSLGKKETPPKKITRTVEVKYEPSEPDKPQTIEVYIDDLNNDMKEPVKKESITSTSTVTIPITIPYGKEAKFKVVRDGKVYAEETIPYSAE